MTDKPTSRKISETLEEEKEDLSQKNPFETGTTDSEEKEINEAKLMAGCCYTGCYDCPWEYKI